jgi:hypothetical protein
VSEVDSRVVTRSRYLVGALVCAGVVLAAVSLEVVGGQNANSPHPAWAEWVVPLAWPQALRGDGGLVPGLLGRHFASHDGGGLGWARVPLRTPALETQKGIT